MNTVLDLYKLLIVKFIIGGLTPNATLPNGYTLVASSSNFSQALLCSSQLKENTLKLKDKLLSIPL